LAGASGNTVTATPSTTRVLGALFCAALAAGFVESAQAVIAIEIKNQRMLEPSVEFEAEHVQAAPALVRRAFAC